MTELQILTAIKNSGNSIRFTDLLNQGLTDPKPDPNSDKLRLEYLLSENYISGKMGAYERLSLTPKGIAHLDQLQQELQKQDDDRSYAAAQTRKQKNFDLISSLVGAVLGAIMTLVIEYLLPLLIALL